MHTITLPNKPQPSLFVRLTQPLVWWCFFLLCLLYSGYAFYMGAVELLWRLGLAVAAPPRGLALPFVLHAFLGGVALFLAPLQLHPTLWQKRRQLHRRLGRVYVVSIWIASASGLGLAVVFDVSMAARVVLGFLALLWFAVTTVALLRIRQRRVAEHREWMIRSFALSFFFVTFSFWVPALAGIEWLRPANYTVAVFLSWSLNLLVAEWWIRYSQAPIGRAQQIDG